MSESIVSAANIIAAIASLTCVVFAALVYRMTRARWTLVMAIGFTLFFVVRLGISFAWPVLDEYSRAITAGIYVVFALGFIWLWVNMRRFYRGNGLVKDRRLAGDRAAALARLAELAAKKSAESAAAAAEAARLSEAIANESRQASSDARASLDDSRE